MDELVRQALLRWPNVPAIAGWLKLTDKGEWLLTGDASAGLKISHLNMKRFIARNYAVDEQGRAFFQNGPQKVYVSLEYTPWLFRVHPVGTGHCLVSHTGMVTLPVAAYQDEQGRVLMDTPLGVGLLHGADLENLPLVFRSEPGGEESLWISTHWQWPDAATLAQQGWQKDTAHAPPTGGGVDPGSGAQGEGGLAAGLKVQELLSTEVPERFCFEPHPRI